MQYCLIISAFTNVKKRLVFLHPQLCWIFSVWNKGSASIGVNLKCVYVIITFILLIMSFSSSSISASVTYKNQHSQFSVWVALLTMEPMRKTVMLLHSAALTGRWPLVLWLALARSQHTFPEGPNVCQGLSSKFLLPPFPYRDVALDRLFPPQTITSFSQPVLLPCQARTNVCVIFSLCTWVQPASLPVSFTF